MALHQVVVDQRLALGHIGMDVLRLAGLDAYLFGVIGAVARGGYAVCVDPSLDVGHLHLSGAVGVRDGADLVVGAVAVVVEGDRAEDAASLNEGDTVTVSVNVESREYNGRWYTEVRAWKIEKDNPASASQSPDYGWGAPASPPAGDMPPVSPEEPVKDEFDDLPF